MPIRHLLDNLFNHHPLWRLLFLVSLAAIAWLAVTSQPYPIPSSSNDKVNHFLAFTELALVIRLGWPAMHLAIPFLLLMGFGLAIELVQAWLPYRYFSWGDLGADLAGILAGFAFYPVIRQIQSRLFRKAADQQT